MKITFKNFNERSLCDRCEHGTVMKTTTDKRAVYCAALMKYVPSNIKECGEYQAKGTMSRYDMEKTAWTLETKNGQVGFSRPEPKKDHYE